MDTKIVELNTEIHKHITDKNKNLLSGAKINIIIAGKDITNITTTNGLIMNTQ